MESFGAYLKRERESRKISLEEISRTTKIRRAILEALEKDQGEVLLPETVVKGFIRTYARYIGLDPKEVIATYTERQSEDKTTEKEQAINRRFPTKYVFAGGIFVLIIVMIPIFFFARGPRESSHKTELTTPPIEQTVIAPLDDLQSYSSLPAGEETIPLQTTPVGDEAVQEVQEIPVVQKEDEVQDVKVVQEEKPSPVDEHTLIITASERTWIQIQEGSSLPFDVILFPGDHFTRTSSQQMAVVVGNAGGITVSFDGKKMGSPGMDGEVVRLTFPSPDEQ